MSIASCNDEPGRWLKSKPDISLHFPEVPFADITTYLPEPRLANFRFDNPGVDRFGQHNRVKEDLSATKENMLQCPRTRLLPRFVELRIAIDL